MDRGDLPGYVAYLVDQALDGAENRLHGAREVWLPLRHRAINLLHGVPVACLPVSGQGTH